VVVAAEVGVDGLTVAVAGLGGTTYARQRVEWRRRSLEPSEVASEIAALARTLVDSSVQSRRVIAAGVAVPGLARTTNGSIALAPNLGWHEVPFGELLEDRLPDRTAVAVGNEADLGALAEFVRGAGVGARQLLYVSGEVGVGGGMICDGRLLGGRDGFAGEVGHFPVNPAGTPCRCGSVGCWETEVGEEALLRRAGRRRGGARRGALETLLQDAAAGDRRVLAALDEHGRWVGIGLAGLVNV
jgi:predicted NBD/HSP70 family sugar kinase